MKLDLETGKPESSPRVPKEKLRKLYNNDAGGILDEELLDEVGITLYCRCESILTASDAAMGKVHCPSCGNLITRTQHQETSAHREARANRLSALRVEDRMDRLSEDLPAKKPVGHRVRLRDPRIHGEMEGAAKRSRKDDAHRSADTRLALAVQQRTWRRPTSSADLHRGQPQGSH